jgi:hypothetical protein
MSQPGLPRSRLVTLSDSPSLLLGVSDSDVNQLGILRLFDGREDETGVGRRVLRAVPEDLLKLSRVGHDGRVLLEGVEGGSHLCGGG